MEKFKHRIIAVTPAGRQRYLEILSKYILSDDTIDEWHLWDNCSNNKDREYLFNLSKSSTKIKIIKIEDADGTNSSIGKFYRFFNSEDAFYIRIDDDVVFLEENFGAKIYERAIKLFDKYLWFSPIVINNALCTYLLFCRGKLKTNYPLSAQCMDLYGWKSPEFAEKLHNWFINVITYGKLDEIRVEGIDVTISRFSINCIGFFGNRMKSLGDLLIPRGDEEEWMSATLPVMLNLPGRIFGDFFVAHFSFYPQESYLLNKTKILNRYAEIAKIKNFSYKSEKINIKKLLRSNTKRFLRSFISILGIRRRSYQIFY